MPLCLRPPSPASEACAGEVGAGGDAEGPLLACTLHALCALLCMLCVLWALLLPMEA